MPNPSAPDAGSQATADSPKGDQAADQQRVPSQEEIDRVAWDRLLQGESPKSISAGIAAGDLKGDAGDDRALGQDGASDDREDGSSTQGDTKPAPGRKAERGAGDTEHASTDNGEPGDASARLATFEASDPEKFVMASQVLRRDGWDDQRIMRYVERMGEDDLIDLAESVRKPRQAKGDAAGNRQRAEKDDESQDPETAGGKPADDPLEALLSELEEDGREDEAKAIRKRISAAADQERAAKDAIVDTWLRAEVDRIAASDYPEAATEDGEKKLVAKMKHLFQTGEFPLEAQADVADLVRSASYLVFGKSHQSQADLLKRNRQQRDAQPDVPSEREETKKPATRIDRDAAAFKALQQGKDPADVNRRYAEAAG